MIFQPPGSEGEPRRFVRPGRHPDDGRIAALAVPALGALAADPLYSLVDTAFVGHLGTPQLGALAIGTAAFTASFWLFSFLAYGVTPRVAGALARDDEAEAARVGMHALALAIVLGGIVTLAGATFAGPIVRFLGAAGDVETFAEPYLRIRILAAVAVLVGQVGHGWLRGAHDPRTAMVIAVGGAVANVVLGYALIFPAGFGIEGAAWAVVICQSGAAAAFVVVLLRRMQAPVWRLDVATARSLLVVGADLAVRTGALLAALTLATAVAARMGPVEVAAWQIAMQVFLFLALSLDSVAIAAQAMVGRALAGPDASRAAALTRRLMEWGIIVGIALLIPLVALARPIASAFTEDPAVVAAGAALLVWVGILQPLAGAAFTLDGILIGASDTRFLAVSMVGASAIFAAAALASLAAGWGLAGLATGATMWMIARTLTTGARWRRGRWAIPS